jgi:hypothetical protein
MRIEVKNMKKASIIASILLLAAPVASSVAFARSGCDGDFEMVNGRWIAKRHCQRQAAENSARASGARVAHHESSGGVTREEYCRGVGHLRIETSSYCAAYSPD